MSNPQTVTAQIRYQLSRMRVENRQHDFEHLARKLSRQRICPNVLPSTGPVGAGGDGGRDFETFRTYLRDLSGATAFGGFAEDGTAIAFACTLQQENLGSKVRSDVASIMADGTPVDAIYFFSEAPIATALRHKLQGEVREQHDVHLEIVDGEAIAEQLSDRDTFWIAACFLHLPADLMPPPEDDDENWYIETKQRWQDRTEPHVSFGDFEEVRTAARHVAIDDLRHIADLDTWLDRLRFFRGDHVPAELQMRAMYEEFVIRLRGLRDVQGMGDTVREYVRSAVDTDDAALLENAQVLVSYCQGALNFSLSTDIDRSEVEETATLIAERLAVVLDESDAPATRARLHMALGAIQPIRAMGATDDEVDAAIDAALTHWHAVLDEAQRDRLYPVNSLADIIERVAPILVERPGYREFVHKLDEVVADRSGAQAAGHQRRSRAVALRKAGHLAASLDEFHQARLHWQQGDSWRGGILSALIIANTYQDLHMLEAAKYYNFAAAVFALEFEDAEHADLAVKAVFQAAWCAYNSGAWLEYLNLARTALFLHQVYETDPLNLDDHPHIEREVLPLMVVKSIAEKARPDLLEYATERLSQCGMTEMVAEALGDGVIDWVAAGDDSIADVIGSQLGAHAFADCGKTRVLRWQALGITWALTFANDFDTTMCAHRLAAMLQILLVELSSDDFCLMPTTVEIEVLCDADWDGDAVEDTGSNEGCAWTVHLAPLGTVGAPASDLFDDAFFVLTRMLVVLSLLPDAELMTKLEERMKLGMMSKLSPGNIYDVLYSRFTTREDFDAPPRHDVDPVCGDFEPQPIEHDDLALPTSPGPGYTLEHSLELIESRYENARPPIRFTLERLNADSEFQNTVTQLRDEGWQDWRILTAVVNVVVNFRTEASGPYDTFDEMSEASIRILRSPEPADAAPVPLALFSADRIKDGEGILIATYLARWKVGPRPGRADFHGLRRAAERYGYFDDDVPHEDPFAASDAGLVIVTS